MVVKPRVKPRHTLHPVTMSTFTFHAVQTLQIGQEDNPRIDVRGEQLILTATRGNDQIMITAPLSSVMPQVAHTTVMTPKRRQKQVRRTKPAGSDNRRRGENSPISKLKDSDIREIRAMAVDPTYIRGFSSTYAMIKDLADTYKVHVTTIYKIVRNEAWKHVS
jgi:hypothetical protein